MVWHLHHRALVRQSTAILILLLTTAAAEDVEVPFNSLELQHRITNGEYAAEGIYRATYAADFALTFTETEPGSFASPVFTKVGGVLSDPEIVKNEPGILQLRFSLNAGPFPEFTVGSVDDERVREVVGKLLRGAEVSGSHKAFSLDSDRERRALLIRVHVLSACSDAEVSLGLKLPTISAKTPAKTEAAVNRMAANLESAGGGSDARKLRANLRKFMRGDLPYTAFVAEVQGVAARQTLDSLKSKGIDFTVSSSESAESTLDKLHRARQIEQIKDLDEDVTVRSLLRLDARELTNHLNLLFVNRLISETGVPVEFTESELVGGILRQERSPKVQPSDLYSTRRLEEMTSDDLDAVLEFFGLDRKLARASTKRKRDELYEVIAWRALVRRNRIQHLDRGKVEEHAIVHQTAALKTMTEQIKKQNPVDENPEKSALTRLVDEAVRRQFALAASGVSTAEWKRFYHPLLAGKELSAEYGFLAGSRLNQLFETLNRFGLKADPANTSAQEAADLYSRALEVMGAATPTDLSSQTSRLLAKRLNVTGTDEVLAAFRSFEIQIRYNYEKPDGPDKNSNWEHAEEFKALTQGAGKVSLSGSLTPAQGDSIDWWRIPISLKERVWKSAASSPAEMSPVTAGNDLLLKVRATGKRATTYKITSDGEGRPIRRIENVETHREIAGPPY